MIGADRSNNFGWYLNKWLYPDETVRKNRDPLLLVNSVNLNNMPFWLDFGEQDYQIIKEGKRFADLLTNRNAIFSFPPLLVGRIALTGTNRAALVNCCFMVALKINTNMLKFFMIFT
ncbi:MAG: hypothetical protein NT086_16685 [Proteobacteria bacterium]|nr:hypothetical protein [Pseudomonadota bacterium]